MKKKDDKKWYEVKKKYKPPITGLPGKENKCGICEALGNKWAIDCMTKKEFEKYYAKNSKMTVEEIRKLGRVAIPCNCDDEKCQGWQMVMNRI